MLATSHRRRRHIGAFRRVCVVLLLLVAWSSRLSAQTLPAEPSLNRPDALVALSATGTPGPPVAGAQKWLTILCKFQDIAAEPKAKSYFETMFTHPRGLDAYWREASYNAINLAGSQVFGWYTLPQPRSFYVVGGHQDMDKTREACTAAADADVDFPDYVGISMMFNGEIDSSYFGITQFDTVTLDGTPKRYPFIWMGTLGSYNEALTAHEMAHGLGLFGHAGVFDANGDYIAGDSWDLLGGTCRYSTYDTTYGCIPVHPVAPSKDILGWIAPSQIFTATSGVSATIRLEQLAQPGPSNYLIAKIPIGGSTTHFYSVEARRKVGFDNTTHFEPTYSIPGSAVLIHEVDLTNFGANHHLIPFRLDPADPENDPGGADAMWTPGRTFTDSTCRIGVTVLSETASGFVVRIQNGVGPLCKLYLPMTMR